MLLKSCVLWLATVRLNRLSFPRVIPNNVITNLNHIFGLFLPIHRPMNLCKIY